MSLGHSDLHISITFDSPAILCNNSFTLVYILHTKGNAEALVVARKEMELDVNGDKTKYTVMS
jgi:hypothetical protein